MGSVMITLYVVSEIIDGRRGGHAVNTTQNLARVSARSDHLD